MCFRLSERMVVVVVAEMKAFGESVNTSYRNGFVDGFSLAVKELNKRRGNVNDLVKNTSVGGSSVSVQDFLENSSDKGKLMTWLRENYQLDSPMID